MMRKILSFGPRANLIADMTQTVYSVIMKALQVVRVIPVIRIAE